MPGHLAQFVPHMLVVQTGTSIEFPNSDVVGHHVYSFSKPNNFVLPLYTGDSHAPVTFDHDGVVMLGCNINLDAPYASYFSCVEKMVFTRVDNATTHMAVEFLASGYRTAAFTDNIWVGRQMGFDRGFDVAGVRIQSAVH